MMSREIQAIRIQSHQLANPGFSGPKDLVAWMGAMQAQDYGMAKWAIAVRLKSAAAADIDAALTRGDILRTHVMRPTWHWVAAEDIRWMLQLSKGRIKASLSRAVRDPEITGELYSRSHRIICKALEGNNHLTRPELAAELDRAGITVGNAYRMSDFMMRAEIEGLVCSGIDRMNERTYALLDERVPPSKALHREEALATLATNYFRSHSPAGLQDFAWWSGLSAGDAKQAVNLIRPELSDEMFGDTHLFVHRSCKGSADSMYGFHLLPSFDEYIIAYRDRTGVLAAEHQPAVCTKNGIFRPAIVENGRVVGVWKKTAAGDGIRIQTSFFDKNGRSGNRMEAAAVNRYKMFYI